MLRLAVLLLLLAAPSSGCIGLVDTDTRAKLGLENRARATGDTGGIEGIVTDPAVQPLEGATARIVQLDRTARVAGDGSFAFSRLQPGAYTVEITARGFLASQREVTVEAGDVEILDVILTRQPDATPYVQQVAFEGFVECSARAGLGVALCSIPNALAGGNATNDRFLFPFDLQADPWQMVTEVRWQARQPTGTHLDAIVEPAGLPNDVRTEYGTAEGESPLRVATDRQRFAEVDRNTTRVCNGEGEDPGQLAANREAYCNRDVLDEASKAWVRIFVSEAEPLPVGATVQQGYELVVTTFYHAPACPGYSVLREETCPQRDRAPSADPAEAADRDRGEA